MTSSAAESCTSDKPWVPSLIWLRSHAAKCFLFNQPSFVAYSFY